MMMHAITQALGLKAKKVKELAPANLNDEEMAKLLKRGRDEDEDNPGGAVQGAMGVPGLDAGEKASGLGFSK